MIHSAMSRDLFVALTSRHAMRLLLGDPAAHNLLYRQHSYETHPLSEPYDKRIRAFSEIPCDAFIHAHASVVSNLAWMALPCSLGEISEQRLGLIPAILLARARAKMPIDLHTLFVAARMLLASSPSGNMDATTEALLREIIHCAVEHNDASHIRHWALQILPSLARTGPSYAVATLWMILADMGIIDVADIVQRLVCIYDALPGLRHWAPIHHTIGQFLGDHALRRIIEALDDIFNFPTSPENNGVPWLVVNELGDLSEHAEYVRASIAIASLRIFSHNRNGASSFARIQRSVGPEVDTAFDLFEGLLASEAGRAVITCALSSPQFLQDVLYAADVIIPHADSVRTENIARALEAVFRLWQSHYSAISLTASHLRSIEHALSDLEQRMERAAPSALSHIQSHLHHARSCIEHNIAIAKEVNALASHMLGDGKDLHQIVEASSAITENMLSKQNLLLVPSHCSLCYAVRDDL